MKPISYADLSAEREGFALDPKGRFHKAERLKERETPVRSHKKKATRRGCIFFAEREGFEPPVPLGTVVFKTTVIDHSTISPVLRCLESGCKGKKIFRNEQIFSQLFFVFPLHFAHLFVPLPSVMAKALPFEFSQIHLENPSLIRTFAA